MKTDWFPPPPPTILFFLFTIPTSSVIYKKGNDSEKQFRLLLALIPDEVNCKVHEMLAFQEWIWKKPTKYA